MQTILHLCVLLAVCQVVLGAQLPYGSPGNPSPFAGQPGPQANGPFNEQDRRVPQKGMQPAYQDPRSRSAQPVQGYDAQPQQQQQNQYQQMMQQQQQQQRPLGVHSSPVYMPFGRIQQEAQGPGIFSKLKSSILAAGSAISESLSQASLDGTPPVSNQPGGAGYYATAGYPLPVQQYTSPQQQQSQQQQQPQQRYPGDSIPGSSAHSNAYPREGGDYRRPFPAGRIAENNSPGLVGKFKSIFGLDDASNSDTPNTSGNYGYNKGASTSNTVRGSQLLTPHLAQQYDPYGNAGVPTTGSGGISAIGGGVANPFGDGYLESNLPQQVSPYGAGVPPFPGDDRGATGPGEYPEIPIQRQQQQQHQQQMQPYAEDDNTVPSADSVSAGLLPQDASFTNYRDMTTSMNPSVDTLSTTTTSASTTASLDPIAQINPEPQVFVHEGSIVMINKPREFGRKKLAFTRAGGDKIQVFSDFEHVLTQFNTVNGERTLTSAELLETSGAVHDRAVQQLNAIAEEFESSGDSYLDSAAFEQLSAQCQRVLCKEGDLHIGAVPQITRALLPRLGLRAGWSDTLQSLATKGVPTYLFSSGYGDVVTQVLLQGMSSAGGAGGAGTAGASVPGVPQPLPQNLRVISNFFRAAPDGTVRAFSQPVVHERNKNASTAAQHMGMSVLNRPYAIVLGAHEDDVNMTEGVEGLMEQISVGYLELTEDFSQRLPIYLNTFDVVIIGDGNLQYVRSMIEDILQLPNRGSARGPSTTNNNNPISGLNLNTLSNGMNSIGLGNIGLSTVGSAGQGIAMGLRNRLGMLLNSGTNNNNNNQQQQQSPQSSGNQYLPGRSQQYQQYPPQVPPNVPGQSAYNSLSASTAAGAPTGYAPYSNYASASGENPNPQYQQAQSVPPTTGYRSQPPQQQQQQAQTQAQQAPPSLPSTLPGFNNPFNTPVNPHSATETAEGEAPRPLSYLDFNEYQ
eukprot:gene10642-12425_t